MKAATKLKNAAQITAFRGDSTRVETIVAIELAASWKPFRKSKTSATRMVTAINSVAVSMGMCSWPRLEGSGGGETGRFDSVNGV